MVHSAMKACEPPLWERKSRARAGDPPTGLKDRCELFTVTLQAVLSAFTLAAQGVKGGRQEQDQARSHVLDSRLVEVDVEYSERHSLADKR